MPHGRCVRLTTSPDKAVGTRVVRKLIDNGPWTLTIPYETAWNWNEVVLLNKLFWIYQFQSLICFIIRLILPNSKCIS